MRAFRSLWLMMEAVMTASSISNKLNIRQRYYITLRIKVKVRLLRQDALKVCAEACIHLDSLILGSRALADNVPLRSRFGNTVTRFVYRLASGVKVHGALDIYGTTNRLTIIYLIVGLVLILAGTIQYAIDCRRYRCA